MSRPPAATPPAGLLSPGHSLNGYLHEAEVLLDQYKHHEITFEQMLDARADAAARHAGHLVDHFLVRAHGTRSIVQQVADAPASAGWR